MILVYLSSQHTQTAKQTFFSLKEGAGLRRVYSDSPGRRPALKSRPVEF